MRALFWLSSPRWWVRLLWWAFPERMAELVVRKTVLEQSVRR